MQMAIATPKLYTTNMRKSERTERVYLDYLRNDKAASAIAAYSTRARAGAPLAMPIDWKDLPTLTDGHRFNMRTAIDSLKRHKADPWNEMDKIKQSLPKL
jgi:bifunctional non-homologous end joining protein LigD